MDEFSVFGQESSASAFAPEANDASRRQFAEREDTVESNMTYITPIAQSVASVDASASASATLASRRPAAQRLKSPVVGVAEEPSECPSPVPGSSVDDVRALVANSTPHTAHVPPQHPSASSVVSRENSQGASAFSPAASAGAAPASAFSSPPIVYTSPLSLTTAPRVKGAVEPQPLSELRKGQFIAAPTGGSDSDTDTLASLHSHGSHRSVSVDGSDSEDEAEEQRFVDEFGFVIDEDQKEADEKFIRKIDGKQVKRREVKWANMASDWSRTNTKMHSKLKERCRKGIPSRMRGAAWQLLCNSRALMDAPENAGVYLALREKRLSDKEVDPIISRDLARTFPKHVLFKDQGGVGQTFLRNVLHAYAGIDPEVGYVQGMAFLVGALSTQMGEEESFWVLHEMMYNERYKMRELYRPGFPLLHQFFYQFKRLLARLLPKLSRHFEAIAVDPSFYASQWFLTLFVYHFPFRALLRVWDVFFSEGWKIVFRIGLALLQWEEKRLLTMPFEDVLRTLKTLQDGKDSKQLLRRAHRIKFKTAELNRYGEEYWQSVGQKPD